jgi:23S rRNA (cytosine1962-C5)-methyltransferase
LARLTLKAGREKSLKRRHPWVFSGAVEKLEGDAKAGDTVDVRSSDGELLAIGAYSPHSQIRARAWAFGEADIDESFFVRRIEDAANARAVLGIDGISSGMRLVHGEADGLPGVIADRYGETVVVQLLSAGGERWRDEIADALCGLSGVERVWERSDADARELEGLKPKSGLLRGKPLPHAPVIEEHGLKFKVEVDAGHKTGFYLDAISRPARTCSIVSRIPAASRSTRFSAALHR